MSYNTKPLDEKDAQRAFELCVSGKRDKKLEEIIIQDAFTSYLYAREIIKDRWFEAESNIAKSSCAIQYARDVIKGRWSEAEKIISKSPRDSFIYARDVTKGRFEEGEDAIVTESFYMIQYAKLLDKLPEKLHNMMVLLSFQDSTAEDVKEYFEEFSK